VEVGGVLPKVKKMHYETFAILKELGITHNEASKLFGVCRGTVGHWVKGGKSLNGMLSDRAFRICQKLKKAKEDGVLPLLNVPKSEKIQIYKKILSKY
jgi:hypothetical protein